MSMKGYYTLPEQEDWSFITRCSLMSYTGPRLHFHGGSYPLAGDTVFYNPCWQGWSDHEIQNFVLFIYSMKVEHYWNGFSRVVSASALNGWLVDWLIGFYGMSALVGLFYAKDVFVLFILLGIKGFFSLFFYEHNFFFLWTQFFFLFMNTIFFSFYEQFFFLWTQFFFYEHNFFMNTTIFFFYEHFMIFLC